MRLGGLGAIILALSSPVPVAAAVLLTTFTGRVDSGCDGGGLFGAAGSDLTGEIMVARFKIDTAATGTVLREMTTFSDIVGGPLFGQTGNAVAGSITIGGVRRSARNDFGSVAVQGDEAARSGKHL